MMYSILHTEWSNGWGGQEIRILEECRGMAARGHRVELAGCPQGKLRPRAEAAGLLFHPLSMAGPWDLAALWRLTRLIKERGMQVVHTHSSVDSWLGGAAARLAGAVGVRCRHLSVPVSNHPLNVVYRLPQAVITTGQGIRRHLIEDYGLPAARVTSIPTGVDTARFAPAPPDPALLSELGLEAGQPVVAVVAVLRSWKRHDLFCQMARQVLQERPRTRFLIVGDGPGRARVAGYLDAMDLRPGVIMTGHREDIERILTLCAVCVLVSDKAEGVSQAVLQELAMERAVVASRAGDLPEVVRHEQTGLLVTPGELEPLTQAVLRLLDDQDLRQRLGRAGRRMVLEAYSREHMLRATEEVYARALAGRPGGGA
ncbi:MAG: glycosyltransferase family 4 protein [Pseudomonadota bacterium]